MSFRPLRVRTDGHEAGSPPWVAVVSIFFRLPSRPRDGTFALGGDFGRRRIACRAPARRHWRAASRAVASRRTSYAISMPPFSERTRTGKRSQRVFKRPISPRRPVDRIMVVSQFGLCHERGNLFPCTDRRRSLGSDGSSVRNGLGIFVFVRRAPFRAAGMRCTNPPRTRDSRPGSLRRTGSLQAERARPCIAGLARHDPSEPPTPAIVRRTSLPLDGSGLLPWPACGLLSERAGISALCSFAEKSDLQNPPFGL